MPLGRVASCGYVAEEAVAGAMVALVSPPIFLRDAMMYEEIWTRSSVQMSMFDVMGPTLRYIDAVVVVPTRAKVPRHSGTLPLLILDRVGL